MRDLESIGLSRIRGGRVASRPASCIELEPLSPADGDAVGGLRQFSDCSGDSPRDAGVADRLLESTSTTSCLGA
jgi:hypothetical protein